jgi:UDP-N-acetylmuramyl pentapeptide phosphotransferase/UDP-N-acetylglucosamine-1-phosphate transferase
MNSLNSTINFSIDFGFILPLFTLSVALIVSYISYPVIIKVANVKNLMAEPNQRDVHATKTPNLGGIGIFLAIYLVVTFLGNYFEGENLLNLSGAMIVMFFIGLVDDLVGVSPKSKLIGQILAALSIILMTDLRLESLYGVFGIYELPYVVSVMLSLLFFVTIINAYNLIDGVDGLAGSFAITANVFFAAFFYFNANYFMCFLSVGIIGALISFLIFNFSKTNKIFMGDTGSMLIGFLLAYQALNFMSVDFTGNFTLLDSKAIVYVLALFSFPLIDTIRVFFIRIKAGKSPFTADNNHMHHNLLACGLKHWEISLVSVMFTVFIISATFLFNELETNKLLLILVSMWVVSAIIIDNLNVSIMPIHLKIKQKMASKINFENAVSTKAGKVIFLKKSA